MNGTTSVIGWDEASPSDVENAGLGDDRMRSIKTSARNALADEHNWPSSGGTGFGYHLKGSARPYYGTQSRVSSDGTDGRLMVASDSSQLFAPNSVGTVLIGGPTVLSLGTFPGTVPQRAQWVEEVGLAKTGAGSGTVTIPNSGYSGKPYVFVSSFTVGPVFLSVDQDSISGTQFTVSSYSFNGASLSNVTYVWRSLGTRTL